MAAEAPNVIGLASTPSGGHTLRDEFARMTSRVPGGFGGVFIDKDGFLTVVLAEPDRSAEARSALASEPFLLLRQEGSGGEQFNLERARFRQGNYSYAELFEWYYLLRRNLPFSPRSGAITVSLNQISIGVANEEQVTVVRDVTRKPGIPVEAVRTRLVASIPLLHALPRLRTSDLEDKLRPLPGGMLMEYWKTFAGPFHEMRQCTVGPKVTFLQGSGPDTVAGFIAPSHCGQAPFNTSTLTRFWQPVNPDTSDYNETTNYIGNEVLDPGTWSPPDAGCTNGSGCRNSDASLVRHKSGMVANLGKIARPASRNTGVITLHSTDPEFSITRVRDWSVEGETLEKVGYASGWTGGDVIEGCEDLSPDNYAQTIMCVMTVEAEASGGDSGAPVFAIRSGTSVALRGVLFAGYETSAVDTCLTGPPVTCPGYVASNWGGVMDDLDPNGIYDIKVY